MAMTFVILAVNGSVYKLTQNNCENDSTGKLIFLIVMSFVISFGLGFLLQKIGFRWNLNEEDKSKK